MIRKLLTSTANLCNLNIENSICIKMIFTGFYPRIHDQGIAPEQWLNSYYLTHLERDVRNILKVGDLEAFGRFIRLCAGRNGQLQIPIEIKSAKTVASDFFDNIHYWLNLSGHPEAFALLIYGGNQHTNRRGVRVLPWFFI